MSGVGVVAIHNNELVTHAEEAMRTVLSKSQRSQPMTWDQARAIVPVTLEDVMAIEPGSLTKAFFPGFFGGEEKQYDRVGPVGIVTIDGPLMQHGGWFWDGYTDIRKRFSAALGDEGVHAVVLKINSPGGMCAGCFEGVAAMLKAKQASGKPVLAYADELAASAAYAIASVADEIWLPESGRVGSIGTVITLVEQSKRLENEGIRVEVIATGKQKTDGHPAIALTPDVIARFRAVADHLNGIFVGQVAAARGLTPAQVLALEAGVFNGSQAIKAGLANGVSSFEAFIARAESLAKTSPHRAVQQAAAAAHTEEENDMENQKAGVAFIAMMAAIMGISASASEAEVQERGRKLADGERDLLKATGKATVDEAIGTVNAWKVSDEAVAGLRKDVAAQKAEGTRRDVDAMIAEGQATGRITSDALLAVCRTTGHGDPDNGVAANPAQLKAFIAALPVVGGGVTKKDATVEAEGAIVLTAEDKEIAQQMGVSLEDVAKTKRDQLARKGG